MTEQMSACPPECRTRLRALEDWRKDVDKNRQEVYKHWEGIIAMKVPFKTFFWVMGILVLVLLSVFGGIYLQGSATLAKIHSADITLTEIQVEVKHNTEQNQELKALLKEHEASARRQRSGASYDSGHVTK